MIDFKLPKQKTRVAIFREAKQEKQAIQEKQVFISGYVEFEIFIRHLNEDVEQTTGDIAL